MFTNILEYLASNKTIVVGATATLAEVTVIIVNTWRKLRADKNRTVAMGMARPSNLQVFLWAANPINLFRQP